MPRSFSARRLGIAALLFLLPVILYWGTIFQRFGFRDDYSTLREANFEPGKVFDFCMRQARPIYGVLLQGSFAWADSVDDLRWLRLLTAGLLGLAAVGTFLVLRGQRWDPGTSALVAALLVVLPAAQVELAWAAIWPHVVALLLALVAFVWVERATHDAGVRLRWTCRIAGTLFVAASVLTYQACTPFYIVLVAAGLWRRRVWVERDAINWVGQHAIAFVAGFVLAMVPVSLAFSLGWSVKSGRVALELNWLDKLVWFVAEPLQNALALIVLGDARGTSSWFRLAALISGGLLLAGVVHRWRKRGLRPGLFWTAAVGLLLVASYGVSLGVREHWPSYRTLVPLSALVLVLVAASLLELGGPRLARPVLAVMLVVGAWLARDQTRVLFADPQAAELSLIEEAAARIDPARSPSVYVIASNKLTAAPGPWFGDEFGTLSSDSDWTPHEMLKVSVWARHPGIGDVSRGFTYDSGGESPVDRHFDVVVDMRQIKDAGPGR